VALAIVLLTAAGLTMRSVAALVSVDPGFRASHVLVVQTNFMGVRFADNAVVLQAQDAILGRLAALPGVSRVAAAGQIPLDGNFDEFGFHIEGRMRGPEGADDPAVERYSVTPDYLATMSIPLIRGRFITPGDRASSEMIVVVNQRAAAELWPGTNPIGGRVRIGAATQGPWRTVVGVVGDVRHRSVASAPPLQMYLPQQQFPDSQLAFVMATTGDPGAVAPAARQAVQSAVPDAPIIAVQPLPALVAMSVGPQRFVMLLLALFGGVALVLTAIGVYGVISYTVTERAREIGIRAALGASRRELVSFVLRHGMGVVLLGVLAGLALAAGGARYLGSSLFEVSPHDPATFVAGAALLLIVALAAHAAPVARALHVSPTAVLKDE
jgi:putative ABC transport system permease protein